MFEKLQADYQRFLELDRSLHDEEVVSDPARVTAVARERGKLAKLAVPYGKYLDLGRQISEAQALLEAESDSEMRDVRRGRAGRLAG